MSVTYVRRWSASGWLASLALDAARMTKTWPHASFTVSNIFISSTDRKNPPCCWSRCLFQRYECRLQSYAHSVGAQSPFLGYMSKWAVLSYAALNLHTAKQVHWCLLHQSRHWPLNSCQRLWIVFAHRSLGLPDALDRPPAVFKDYVGKLLGIHVVYRLRHARMEYQIQSWPFSIA